jgi:hypothetical protein
MFSVKYFVHQLLGVATPAVSAGLHENEDFIFAFQEKMCALVEIEVIGERGDSVAVFPNRLNMYLEKWSMFSKGPDSRGPPKRPPSNVLFCHRV